MVSLLVWNLLNFKKKCQFLWKYKGSYLKEQIVALQIKKWLNHEEAMYNPLFMLFMFL